MHALEKPTGIALVALAVLSMAGCSSPPSISFPKDALQQANPHDVRVAVNLPNGVKITHLNAYIAGTTKNDNVSTTLRFSVVPSSQALASPPVQAAGIWTYYSLAPESIEKFKKIQAFAAQHFTADEQTTIKVNVHNKLALADCSRKGKVWLVAAILFDPSRGYAVVWNENDPLSHLASLKNRICTKNLPNSH